MPSTMLITTQALKKVSKELINKRNYDSSKITKVGEVEVNTDGVASRFATLVTGESVPSFLKYEGLSFINSDKLNIILEGKYVPKSDNNPCCFWSLIGTNVNPLNVKVYSDKVQFCIGDNALISITELSISENDKVRVEVTCEQLSCKVTAIIAGEEVYEKEETYTEYTTPYTFSSYTTALIGSINTIGTNYWQGSIDVPTFSISKNNTLYYTPSIDNIFKFTKILVCDASVTLEDDTKAINNHCYELTIGTDTIKRSFNNILIVAQIPSEAYLNINKIGLYSTGDDGTQLFALLDNIMIKKTKDVGYNLIININIDLNVVNTLVMPDFILTEYLPVSYTDFENIRRIFTIVGTNLERMIKTNAREVGYKKPQVNYRLEDNIELIEDNYTAVRDYLRADEIFQVTTEDVFDYNKADVHEPLTIEDGIASDFEVNNSESIYRYITTKGMAMGGSNSWEFVVPFITGSDVTTTQEIVSANSINSNSPFYISIENGFCNVNISSPEVLTLTFSLDSSSIIYTKSSEKTVIENQSYYAWYTSTIPAYGMILKDSNDVIYTYNKDSGTTTISGTNYYTWSASDSSYSIQKIYSTESNPTNSSALYKLVSGSLVQITELSLKELKVIDNVYTKVKDPDSSTPIYYKDNGTPIQVTTLTFSSYTKSVLIDDEQLFAVSPYTVYYLKIIYDTTSYNFYLSSDGYNYTLIDTEEISTEMAKFNNLYVGVLFLEDSLNNPFKGKINLNNLYLNTIGFKSTQVIMKDSSSVKYTYNTNGQTTVSDILYYSWSASSSSYSIRNIYTLDPNPASTSRFFKLVSGSMVALTELTFDELITVPTMEVSSLTSTITTNNSVLKDYFHIPTYNYSSYAVVNLNNDNSKLSILDNTITGNGVDNINFSGSKGFTLATKVYLKEAYNKMESSTTASSKTILAKLTLGSSAYLNISLSCDANKKNFTLSASLAGGDYVLSQVINKYNILEYVENPILLTITYNADLSNRLLAMYKNNKLVTSQLLASGATIDAPLSTDIITNYLSTSAMSSAEDYVTDIIYLDGPVNKEQLYYLTNLLDCNF